MSSEDNKVKRTSTKKETTKKKTDPTIRIIWLYAAHLCIVKSAVNRLLDFGSKESIKLRQQLGLTLNDAVLPVYPYPASKRGDIISELSETALNDTTIIVIGLSTDKKSKEIQKHYKETEFAWIHPHERQFHIDMMRENMTITFQEAEKEMEESLKFFEDHFKSENIQVVR